MVFNITSLVSKDHILKIFLFHYNNQTQNNKIIFIKKYIKMSIYLMGLQYVWFE